MIDRQCRRLRVAKGDLGDCKSIMAYCDLEIQRIKGFRRATHALLDQASGTSQLVSLISIHRYILRLTSLQLLKLMDYRKADIQNSYSKELRRLATAANAQGDSVRELTEETVRDSQSVKRLSFVAMMFLPANLMAVSAQYTHGPC